VWWTLALLACGPGDAVRPAATPGAVRVLFQSKGEGEIEPCG
jgi:hypothetical protein